MQSSWKFRLLTLFLCFATLAIAEMPKGMEFSADHYVRDLNTKKLIGKGNAWIKGGGRQIWADEVEIDFATNRGIANGHVRLSEGNLTLHADHADFNIKGADALFDNATLLSGKMVITGETIRRLDTGNFEIDDGTYSNCNVDLKTGVQVAECPLDWRLSGRRFRVQIGGYAHFYDVLIKAKQIPILYTPYIILPVKSERQTGLLIPSFTNSATLGSAIVLPFFVALAPWTDMTLTATPYSGAGLHGALNYRYVYSPSRQGYANIFFVTRRYGPADNPGPDDPTKTRFLGLFGGGAIQAHNLFSFENSRAQSRQMITWVSNPFYTFDYAADVGARADLGNLRSQLTYTYPGDNWLFTGQAQYLQSLIVSKDSGVDGGGVSQLPVVGISRTNDSLLGQWVSYEFDSQFTNFSRGTAFDQVPSLIDRDNANGDSDLSFDANDYLRTGQRLHVEPRIVANVPMPPGFQFQPLVRFGSLMYHFDLPTSSVRHREYVDVEVPLAMQLSRVFETSIPGYEKISHVFQPRFIYASSLLQTGGTDHPFFYQDLPAALTDPANPFDRISNPRFDILDQITPYEYMRFELINRFQRRQGGDVERFFWFQVSEQYNLRISSVDPRFRNRLGPIEVLSSLGFGNLSMQLQASLPLEATTTFNGNPIAPIHETLVSTGLSYRGSGRNVISLNGIYRKSADPGLNALTTNLYAYKELPTFFDLEGSLEYNFLTHELYGYRVGFHFRSKPRSCWSLSLTTGRNAFRVPITQFSFALDFGSFGGI